MTKFEYAKHLAQAASLEINLDCDEDELEDKFYGLFQCFMPEGDGVEAVFAPLKNGDELKTRIMPIYASTSQQTQEAFERGAAPGYFCPPPTDAKEREEALKTLALTHVRNLKIFAEFLGDDELSSMLDEVKSARVEETFDFEDHDDELGGAVYEAITEWMIDAPKLDGLLETLGEAYYSVNCDYLLGAYLQYPNYAQRPKEDFLRAYFELYLAGYSLAFDGDEVVVFGY